MGEQTAITESVMYFTSVFNKANVKAPRYGPVALLPTEMNPSVAHGHDDNVSTRTFFPLTRV